MPLVASNSGGEAWAACPGSATGSIICLWRPWSPAGCGVRGPNEREVHRDPSRRARAAELPPTSLRSAPTKGTRGSKRYARSTGATRSGAAGPEDGANPGDKRLHRCRDSSGWTARPAPRGARWLERKPCGSFIRHRAREHPQAEAYLDACLDATVIAGAQRTSRCSTR